MECGYEWASLAVHTRIIGAMSRTTVRTALLLGAIGAMTYSSLFTSDTTLELLLVASALVLFLVALVVDPTFRESLNRVNRAPLGASKSSRSTEP